MLLDGMSGTEIEILLRLLASAHRITTLLQRYLYDDEVLVADVLAMKVLSLWAPTGGVSPTEVARTIGVSAQRMSLVMRTLRERGWVEVRPNGLDRRYRPVRLTAEGAEIQADTERALEELGRFLMRGLCAEARVSLVGNLGVLDRASRRQWLASNYDRRHEKLRKRAPVRPPSLVFLRQRGGALE
jgi:DNA-binding MarR family transcriptional regulator